MSDTTRAAVLTAGYYAAVFIAMGAMLPFWPVWLQARGLDEAAIGWLLGSMTLVRIAGSTVLPAIADRYAVRRAMLGITAALSAVVAIALLVLPLDPVWLLIVCLVWGFVMAPTVPLGEALGLRAATNHGFAYAPVRAAGSIGFLLANLALGAGLERLGPDLVIWTIAVAFLAVAVLGLVHPGGGAAPGDGRDKPQPGELRYLLTRRVVLVFAVAAAANQSSHMVYYGYSVLDWQTQGISGATIGQLWALGVLAETVLMLGPGRHLITRISPAGALGLAAVAGALRWAAMAGAPSLEWLWPLQALHAVSFGIGHLGAMAFLAAAVPGRLAGSTQGALAGICNGSASALVLFAAGSVIASGGIAAGYWMCAAISLIGVVAAVALACLWRGERLVDG
ncbi:MAG: MFS transporter [Pseudomonadota bacterium]